MDRRGFLKRAGAAAVTVVAAPLFIPSDRLDFGVPRRIIVPEPFRIIGGEATVDAFLLKTHGLGEAEIDRILMQQYGVMDLEVKRSSMTMADYVRQYDSAPGVDTFASPGYVLPPSAWRRVNADYRESTGVLKPWTDIIDMDA